LKSFINSKEIITISDLNELKKRYDFEKQLYDKEIQELQEVYNIVLSEMNKFKAENNKLINRYVVGSHIQLTKAQMEDKISELQDNYIKLTEEKTSYEFKLARSEEEIKELQAEITKWETLWKNTETNRIKLENENEKLKKNYDDLIKYRDK
jgi:chromosome segregation ATPase